MTFRICCSLFLVLLFSCVKDEKKQEVTSTIIEKKEKKEQASLPFTNIELKDLKAFKPTGKNWTVVGDVIGDMTKEKTISSSEGNGILLNRNDQKKNQNLFTTFEHSDIEIEFDVMMPLKSNSGVYFQSRYEIQLLDSWGVEKPKYGDIGGVYQRWNKEAEKGKEGYEGQAPMTNAAKAPGLWQHFKIIFHGPKFDDSGKKIKNAWFEKVWLNGVLIQQNIEVTGPTRGAAFNDEKPKGAIMIQGDHGPVAFKNIKYKLYEGHKIKINSLVKKIYESNSVTIGDLDTIPVISETSTNTFSFSETTQEKSRKMVVYQGTFTIPVDGTYLFDGRTNAVAELFISNQSVLKMRGDMDRVNVKVIDLRAGTVQFQLIYNQNKPWMRGFTLQAEGPNMQKYALQEGGNSSQNFDPLKGIIIEPNDKPLLQRSFVNHEGEKRTHCISVGTPQNIHYSYDLATGSLLKVWSGPFLNTTHMWLSRGKHQLGEPIGFAVSLHGDLEIAKLKDKDELWPKPLPENKSTKQLGYELDQNGIPSFSYMLGDAKIINTFNVPDGKRQLNKSVRVKSDHTLWHKIAHGETIKMLHDNLYIINNESYYINFSNKGTLNPIIRNSNGKDELIVKIPKGDNTINYSIIW